MHCNDKVCVKSTVYIDERRQCTCACSTCSTAVPGVEARFRETEVAIAPTAKRREASSTAFALIAIASIPLAMAGYYALQRLHESNSHAAILEMNRKIEEENARKSAAAALEPTTPIPPYRPSPPARDYARPPSRNVEPKANASLQDGLTPEEMAAETKKVASEKGDAVAIACRARSVFNDIPEKSRGLSAVRSALFALQAKEAEALRQQQREAEPNRGLICADGTESDSCMCHGKRRGCCSHHGGVRGCTPLPTKLVCP